MENSSDPEEFVDALSAFPAAGDAPASDAPASDEPASDAPAATPAPDTTAASAAVVVNAPPTATLGAAPAGLVDGVAPQQAALIRTLLEKIEREEKWAERAAYENRNSGDVAMVAMIQFNTDYWRFLSETKDWTKDPDATHDSLLRYVNSLVGDMLPMIQYVHRAALGLMVHQEREPGSSYPREMRRLAQLMSTPCAGMAQAVCTRPASKHGHHDAEYALQFRRIPVFMPAPPRDDAFDDLKLVHFIEAYHLATSLSIAAGILAAAIDLHRSLYTAALAAMAPPRAPSAYALQSYASCMQAFSPFLSNGRIHYNPHGRTFRALVHGVFVATSRHMAAHPADSTDEVALRFAVAHLSGEPGEPAAEPPVQSSEPADAQPGEPAEEPPARSPEDADAPPRCDEPAVEPPVPVQE